MKQTLKQNKEIILDYTDLPLKIFRQSEAEEKTREMEGKKRLSSVLLFEDGKREGAKSQNMQVTSRN